MFHTFNIYRYPLTAMYKKWYTHFILLTNKEISSCQYLNEQ